MIDWGEPTPSSSTLPRVCEGEKVRSTKAACAFPASFVALLAPHLRHRPGRVAACSAAAIAVATVPVLPVGVPILLTAVGAAVALFDAERRAGFEPATEDAQ